MRACVWMCASNTLSGHKWGRATRFDSCIGEGHTRFLLTCPQKGPVVIPISPLLDLRVLIVKKEWWLRQGRLGCKRQARLLSEVCSMAPWRDGPRYHAALATVCRIREKLNANGDGIWICCLGASFRRRGPRCRWQAALPSPSLPHRWLFFLPLLLRGSSTRPERWNVIYQTVNLSLAKTSLFFSFSAATREI